MLDCPKCKGNNLYKHDYHGGDYSGYCIFHCAKDDVRIVKWNEGVDDVIKFWRALENFIQSKSSSNSIHISDIIFPTGNVVDTMRAFNKSKCKTFHFYDCHFVYNLTFSNTDSMSFEFTRTHFHDAFSLLNAKSIGKLSFEESTFDGTVEINNIDTKEVMLANIVLSNCTFNESFYIRESSIKLMHINGCGFNKIFKLELVNTFPSIRDSTFKGELTINNEPHVLKRDTSYSIDSLWFENLVLEKNFSLLGLKGLGLMILKDILISEKAVAIIGNSECSNLLIENFQNLASNLKIVNVLVKNSLEMDNVTLGKCEFNNFNLIDATSLEIKNTSFSESKLTNVLWGKIVEDRFPDMSRQTARQLKATNDTQGETVIANQFYTLEMRLRSKELDLGYKQIGEKLIQNIHELISNHSSDWMLASIWFFIFGFLFAVIAKGIIPTELVTLTFGAILLAVFLADKIATKLYMRIAMMVLAISAFFYSQSFVSSEFFAALINPLNFKDSKDLLKSTNLFLVYTCRIIEMFIGYQIITAIRKNTRRK
jgi:hypothetical protein